MLKQLRSVTDLCWNRPGTLLTDRKPRALRSVTGDQRTKLLKLLSHDHATKTIPNSVHLFQLWGHLLSHCMLGWFLHVPSFIWLLKGLARWRKYQEQVLDSHNSLISYITILDSLFTRTLFSIFSSNKPTNPKSIIKMELYLFGTTG